MRRMLRILLAAVLALAAWQVQARANVPIVNHENVVITTASGRTPTLDEIRNAIVAAASLNSWQVNDAGPGHLVATLFVRGKHTVVTDIKFSAQSFSVTYRDSTNMHFVPGDGAGTIHPHYNTWVQSLVSSIRTRVSTL